MSGGFFLMQRGWLDDPIFQSSKREPFCHRAAWAWLIEHAAFSPTTSKGHVLGRGQIASTLLDMGSVWGWNTTKVARFLTALRERGLIVTASVKAATILTVCFYDDYQSPEKSTVKATVPPLPVTVKSDRYGTKKEGKEVISSEPKGSSETLPARTAAEEMVSVWRDECGDALAVPAKLDASRIAGSEARLKDSFGRDLDQWRTYCQRIRGSPFCCGDNDRGWRADYDWALKPKTIRGVLEGKYERRSQPRRTGAIDNLVEGFGRAAGLRRGSDAGLSDWPAADPLLDGEHVGYDA